MKVRQSKLLKAKRGKVGELSELNVEAEKMKTYGRAYPEEFRRRYATCIVELEEINGGIEKGMRVIQEYMGEIAEDATQDGEGGRGALGGGSGTVGKMVFGEKVKENADKEARDIVSTCNLAIGVNTPKIKELVKSLASLMLQAKVSRDF